MERIEEKVIQKQRKFDGVVIDVEHWQVQLPDGNESLREVVLHKGAAAVIPVDDKGRVAMVRQYRTPIERVTLELREETGLHADKWRKLVVLRTTPGFCNETIHMYMAQGLSQGSQDLDEDEFLNVEWMPIGDVVEMILEGKIEDSKTIAAVMMAWEILRREQA